MKSQIGNSKPVPKTGKTVHVVGNSEIAPFGKTPQHRLKLQIKQLDFVEVDNPADADLILSGACVYGMSVLKALADSAAGTLLLDNENLLAGIHRNEEANNEFNDIAIQQIRDALPPEDGVAKTGADLAGRYDRKLRKRTDPMVLHVRDSTMVERALFAASYKGVTDFVTKHVWPAPALIVTRWCAAKNITPNQVTWMSAVLVGLTFWLFWTGAFALGLITAWAMTFLDTVDGKLARVTLTSSRFGDILDHGIDLIHPPFWWWAFAIGCAANGVPLEDGGIALGIIVAGYILQRVEEGVFITLFGMQMHIWRPFDSFFRQITARRNPNLVILTLATIIGYPREGLIIVAVWTAVCLVVHLIQIIQGFFASRQRPLTSWLAED